MAHAPGNDAGRFSLPEEEARHPWLTELFRAYWLLDTSLTADIKRTGKQPACKAGCEACCYQPIPVTPAEIMGIRLFLSARTEHAPLTFPLDMARKSSHSCLFLEGGRCRVYPVRPFACRRFIVFNVPCRMGENPTEIRPKDVLAPSRNALLHALRMTLPYYAAMNEPDRPDAAEADMKFFLKRTFLLQQLDVAAFA